MKKTFLNLLFCIFLGISTTMLNAKEDHSYPKKSANLTNAILVFDNLENNTMLSNNLLANTDHNLPKAMPKRYRNSVNLDPKLYSSASAQPNLLDLKYIIAKAKKHLPKLQNQKIFIIDLRQEPHTMLNGNSISWYGLKNQIPYELEENLIENLSQQKMIKVYKGIHKLPDGHFMPKGSLLVKSQEIMTEEDLVKNLGLSYVRILVQDHFAPEDQQIDLFINFIRKLPKNSWLHFHCRGGRGRSTTFMAMLDIINHRNSLSLEEILIRQEKIGGITLSKTQFNSELKKWKEPEASKRYNFIKNFYEYTVDPKGYNLTSWSKWKINQH